MKIINGAPESSSHTTMICSISARQHLPLIEKKAKNSWSVVVVCAGVEQLWNFRSIVQSTTERVEGVKSIEER
jgi:hypothetical protein